MMKNEYSTVAVIGLGYIGLPTAAAFAARKVRVIGVDVNQHAVNTINKGAIHIAEPELDIVVHAAVTEGYLSASATPEPADAFLLAVPTPFRGDHEPDLSYVEAAAKSIAPVLKKGDLVILESTSPVGATQEMAQWLAAARPDLTFPQQTGEDSDIRVAHCPERVLPGHIMRELIQNDRVIGGMTPKCALAASNLYGIFVEGERILTDARTAEMCKLAENAFRDVNIAFANELSMICDSLKINPWGLIKLANRHPRVNILEPGPGVGGHCIAVDPWFIVHSAPEQAKLIKTARLVNNSKPGFVLAKVDAAVAERRRILNGRDPQEIRIACCGLAFKPNIDDLRESPAVQIALSLADKYPGQVVAVEPNISEAPASLQRKNVPIIDLAKAIESCDILVLLVAHRQFQELTLADLGDRLVVDTKGIWIAER